MAPAPIEASPCSAASQPTSHLIVSAPGSSASPMLTTVRRATSEGYRGSPPTIPDGPEGRSPGPVDSRMTEWWVSVMTVSGDERARLPAAPADWQVVDVEGLGPFLTRARYRRPDGVEVEWTSRRHRKSQGL